jgi:fimbrial isopeptide formation D2 family protein
VSTYLWNGVEHEDPWPESYTFGSPPELVTGAQSGSVLSGEYYSTSVTFAGDSKPQLFLQQWNPDSNTAIGDRIPIGEAAPGGNQVKVDGVTETTTYRVIAENCWTEMVDKDSVAFSQFTVTVESSDPTITKKVVDQAAARLGDELGWTVSAGIPKPRPVPGTDPVELAIDGYMITEKLDSRLQLVDPDDDGNLVEHVTVSLVSDDVITSPLPGSDVTYSGSTHVMSVTCEETCLAVLADAVTHNPASQVQLSYSTTVLDTGHIPNVASLYQSLDSFPDDPFDLDDHGEPILSNIAISKWGSVTVQKRSASGAALGAQGEGASFQVYLVDPSDPENEGAQPIEIGGDGDATTTGDGGVSSWTTGATGEVKIEGLRYSDWKNGEAVVDPMDYQHYWLVETKAPPGFELAADPIRFDVTAASSALSVGSTPLDDPGLTGVDNLPHNAGFRLPFVGGPGAKWWTICGAVLLLVAALLAFLSARRRRS